ncbi:MAG: hypothetical protein MUF00_03475 [Gemmatimonadaceae bacterium]|jgi:hypothetical protein|nr:hypothetical protein [Gemmatimonadaceae bacterium]
MSDAERLTRSIADLDGLSVERGAYETGRVAWLSRALVSPLGQLGPAEYRLLMQHERGLQWVLPLIVARLEREPFTPIDGEPAALLLAALTLPLEHWRTVPALLLRLRDLLDALGDTDAANAALTSVVAARVQDDVTVFRTLCDAEQ